MEATIDAVVTGVVRVTPGFVRIRLAVANEGAWASTGIPDEFVHIDVGVRDAAEGDHPARHYTVSGLIPEGFEIEVVLHGHGPGARWGQTVRVGDTVLVSQPMGYYGAPSSEIPRVLVGDATALPAIARILAEASPQERFRVWVELAQEDDRRDLVTAAHARVQWCVGGNGQGESTMVEAAATEVAAALEGAASEGSDGPDSGVYAWVACESAVSRQVRSHLRRVLGLPAKAVRIIGYWHQDAHRVRAVWEGLSAQQRDAYAAMWRDDRTDEENWEELEPFLRTLGV